MLRQAGDDPVMREVQDGFFDRVYWVPATKRAVSAGISTALGTTVVYDSTVHGSWSLIQGRTTAAVGSPAVAGEKAWIAHYVSERRAWLASFDPATSLLPRTVYRMDEIKKLIGASGGTSPCRSRCAGWRSTPPRSCAGAPVIASAMVTEERHMRLQQPFMQGEDVRALQQALAAAGFPMEADGVFGPGDGHRGQSLPGAEGARDGRHRRPRHEGPSRTRSPCRTPRRASRPCRAHRDSLSDRAGAMRRRRRSFYPSASPDDVAFRTSCSSVS